MSLHEDIVLMQGAKTSRIGRSFALAAQSDSCQHRRGSGRLHGSKNKTKEERRVMIKSFVEKYKASNKGEFPPLNITLREVGGNFYTVREILQELKEKDKSYDNLGTDLEVIKTQNQTKRHAVQPLSLPTEVCMPISSASSGVTDSNHSLELKEEKYHEALVDTKEQKNIIHNDVIETCGPNNQTQANLEKKTVERALGTNAASVVVGLQPLLSKGQSSEKEVQIESKNFILDENQKCENTHEPAILFPISETKDVTNRNVTEFFNSSVENVRKYKASEVMDQECNLTHDTNSSASISLNNDVCLPESQSSYELGSHSLEKQNLSGSLEELEHALPTESENGSMFSTESMTSPCSPLAENSSYRDSITRVTELPVDLSYSVNHEEENAPLLNSTKKMLEKPETPADKVRASVTDLCIAPGEATEILEGQKLSSSNISADQILTGVKAFSRVLLHRLALSALIIQTLVDAADASPKDSSELQPETSDGFSSSKSCMDLTNKTETASLATSLHQGQSNSIGNTMQTTNNSSNENITNISDNNNGMYTQAKSLKVSKKLETNIIIDFFTNIANGVLYILKK